MVGVISSLLPVANKDRVLSTRAHSPLLIAVARISFISFIRLSIGLKQHYGLPELLLVEFLALPVVLFCKIILLILNAQVIDSFVHVCMLLRVSVLPFAFV